MLQKINYSLLNYTTDMDQPPQDGFSIIGFIRDNIGAFITGGGLFSLLQFFRSKRKDAAESKESETKAEQAASEMWKKELSDYKAFVKELVSDMRDEIIKLRNELEMKEKEIDVMQKKISSLEHQLAQLSLTNPTR